MWLMYKQLTKELLRNRVFVLLLVVLAVSASFMYFFVQFSIDVNMTTLKLLGHLPPNKILYMNALNANAILGLNFLIVLTALTAFVHGMFFYRFFRKNKKQVGCLKAIGFKDRELCLCFVVFSILLSLIGSIFGLIGGYFGSDILINANMRSYSVSGLAKGISHEHLVTGLLSVAVASAVVTFVVYSIIRGKEIATLISGSANTSKDTAALRFAEKLVNILPVKNKFPVRIALRKPIAIIMIVIAVMGFTVMFIMGNSLNLSSGKVYKSQTEGHLYLYDTQYEQYSEQHITSIDIQTYLSIPGEQSNGSGIIEQRIVGLEENKKMLLLADSNGEELRLPTGTGVYINPALHELYGYKKGDTIVVTINGIERDMVVSDIAANATSGCVYMDKNVLADLLDISSEAYNGALSMYPLNDDGTVITYEQKLEALERASVSNQNSAVINQVIGILAGCILIFLALLLNFQDSTRDILILHLMGYRAKNIREMLIDIYKPILWVSFLLSLWPSIIIAQAVQKSLSIQTGDYMPFGTNALVILIVFILLNVIYLLVQAMFNIGIRRVIAREEVSEYTNAE